MPAHQRHFPYFPAKPVTAIALLLAVSSHIFLLHFFLGPADSKPATQNVTFTLTASPLQRNLARQNSLNITQNRVDDSQVKSDVQQVILDSDGPIIESGSENKPYYFKYDEVSSKPVVITDLPSDFSLPVLPDPSQTLTLTLRISNKGEIDEVLIDQNIEENARQSIINAFKAMKFEAARIDEISVPSEILIEALENTAE